MSGVRGNIKENKKIGLFNFTFTTITMHFLMNDNSYILYLDNIVFVFMKKKSRVNKIYLWTQKSNKGFYLICTDKNKDDESQSLALCTTTI